MSCSEIAAAARRVDRRLQRAHRSRVLAAQVQPAVRAAGGERGDRHRLDDGERITLHQHAVLERAGLGLVGVAHEVMRLHGLPGHGLPLAAGGERRTATADEA